MRKIIRLFFIRDDRFRQLRVFHVFLLHTRGYLCNYVGIIPYILFHFVRVHVQIQHALRERVQEIGIVRDDHARLRVIDEELREMRDALAIEIICRLI